MYVRHIYTYTHILYFVDKQIKKVPKRRKTNEGIDEKLVSEIFLRNSRLF